MLLALWISDVRASALIAIPSSYFFFFFFVKSGVRGAKPQWLSEVTGTTLGS